MNQEYLNQLKFQLPQATIFHHEKEQILHTTKQSAIQLMKDMSKTKTEKSMITVAYKRNFSIYWYSDHDLHANTSNLKKEKEKKSRKT